MSENRMKEVAAMFGLELDVDFVIQGATHNPYRFAEKGLLDFEGDRRTSELEMLIFGKREIKKLPWKPKIDEAVYVVDVGGNYVAMRSYDDSIVDNYRLEHGMMTKTPEEANERLEKIKKWLKEEFVK